MRRAPGVLEDVVRATALLPGVSVTSGGRNDLAVRGGAPYENLFLVDNLEVPNINHFGAQGSTGGAVSILNIDLIREVTFSSGGYGAQYGDRTASVTGLTLREGNGERLAGSVNLSATGLWAIGEGPLGENGTFVASVRRSYLDLIFKLADFAFVPEYWDAQVKVTQRFGTKERCRSSSSVRWTTSPSTTTPRRTGSTTAHRRTEPAELLQRHHLEALAAVGTPGRTARPLLDPLQHRAGRLPSFRPVYANRSEEGDNSLRTDLTSTCRGRCTFGNTAALRQPAPLRRGAGGRVRTDSLNPAPLSVDTAFTAFRNATYAEGGSLPGRCGWSRACAATTTASSTPSVWRPGSAPTFRSAARPLNLSAGGTTRRRRSSGWWAIRTTDRLEPIRADQVVAGYERLLRPDLTAQVELYYKKYADYPARLFRPQAVLQPTGFDDVTTDIPSGLEPLSSIGTGRSYGAELLLQKRLGTVPLYGLVSLPLNRTEFSGVDGVYYTGASRPASSATSWRDGGSTRSGK